MESANAQLTWAKSYNGVHIVRKEHTFISAFIWCIFYDYEKNPFRVGAAGTLPPSYDEKEDVHLLVHLFDTWKERLRIWLVSQGSWQEGRQQPSCPVSQADMSRYENRTGKRSKSRKRGGKKRKRKGKGKGWEGKGEGEKGGEGNGKEEEREGSGKEGRESSTEGLLLIACHHQN